MMAELSMFCMAIRKLLFTETQLSSLKDAVDVGHRLAYTHQIQKIYRVKTSNRNK